MTAPDAAMMAPVERLARFMATLDETHLEDTFTVEGVTIHENFAPFIFAGTDAVARWTTLFRDHAQDLANLKHSFGPAQDFHTEGVLAYFALPTTWTGLSRGRSFIEMGGWSFVLTRQNAAWHIKAYAWAVTSYKKE